MKQLVFRGDRLLELRGLAGMTQQEVSDALAAKYEISANQSYISHMEQGKKRPSFEVLDALVDLFETTHGYLLDANEDGLLMSGGRQDDVDAIQRFINSMLALSIQQRDATWKMISHYDKLPISEQKTLLSLAANAMKLPFAEMQMIAHMTRRLVDIPLPTIRSNEGEEAALIIDAMAMEERPLALEAVRGVANNSLHLLKEMRDQVGQLMDVASRITDPAVRQLVIQIGQQFGITADNVRSGK